MPRDGSNIYSQPFPDVVEDTTIESTVYNGFTNDVAQDLNTARPIVAGGTGATSATDARFNLATEVATQVVTNYDSHLWIPGSFRSASSASGQPVASHAFAGWCYLGEDLANPPTNQNVVIHAYDFDALATTSLLYTRQKKAGVWSNWSITTTEANQAGARQAIYAAPFDALAYNGMQINGSMEVSQEKGTTATSSGYVCDGWKLSKVGSMVVSAGITTTVGLFGGLPQYQYINVSTAQVSMGAGDLVITAQPIEGWRVARLGWGAANAQPITIGFWCCHALAGLYSGSVRNATTDRNYVFTYNQNSGGAPEYKTVTIPGDTTGTWTTDNTAGIHLSFVMASGSSYTAPAANTWAAGNFVAAPGQVNAVASTSNAFRITGVVVLPGVEAPSAARSPLIMRPYDQELVTCQRYYQKWLSHMYGGWYIPSAAGVYQSDIIAPAMRAPPTVTVANLTANLAISLTANSSTINHILMNFSSTAAGISYIIADTMLDARL